MYQQWLEGAFFRKSAAEVQHRRWAILKDSGIYAEASGTGTQSMLYPGTHLYFFFGDFLPLVLSTFVDEKALKEKRVEPC